MPVYNVKPIKNNGPMAIAEDGPKERYPTCYLQVSKEILDSLEIDKPCVVTIKGIVKGLSSNQNDYEKDGRNELTIELRQVEAYPEEKEAAAGDADEPAEAEDEETEEAGAGGMQAAIDKGLGYAKKKDAAE